MNDDTIGLLVLLAAIGVIGYFVLGNVILGSFGNAVSLMGQASAQGAASSLQNI
jgi:hypothetical protein